MKKFIFNIIILSCFLALTNHAFLPSSAFAAEIPAFPGAVGFGSTTPGGRGGKIIEVTNLNDSGVGSLRNASESSGARIVVFRTGGTIKITKNINIKNPFITIAGQSAPGEGISIRGAGITIATHDVVIRGLRIRVGDNSDGPNPDNRDALQIQGGAYNVIIDHCSFSWAVDETVTFWNSGTRNATISYSIISEALYNSIHPEGKHSMGSLVGQGVENIAYIGNLFAHTSERNPKVRFTSGVIVNNVVYDRGYKDIDIEYSTSAQKISVVGNYFIKGNSHYGNAKSIYIRKNLISGTKIYIDDNDCSDYNTGNCVQNLSTGFDSMVGTAPIWPSGLEAKPSGEVVDWVLANVGARPSDRDPVDARIISDVKNGSGQIIDSQNQVGGWPNLNSGTPPIDTDHDGMPDWWENEYGLNPNDYADRNGDKNGDGYTNVENYLNELITAAVGGPADEVQPPQNLRIISSGL